MDNYTKLKNKITLLIYEIIEKREETIKDLENTDLAIAETTLSMYEKRKQLIHKSDLLYSILTGLNTKKEILSELLEFAHDLDIESIKNKN